MRPTSRPAREIETQDVTNSVLSKPLTIVGGRVATLSHVAENDAAMILDYVNTASGETDFLAFGPGEFGMTLDEEAAHIQRLYADRTGFILKAVVDGEIVSLAGVKRTQRPRVQHVGLLGISVLKKFWGTGIGPAICRQVLVEAEAMGLRRVELRVREDNLRAIRLYQSIGFREEGRLRGAFVVADKSYDELIMGLLFPVTP
jgi:RimJ/RimL family protein N-acetyltransferase